MDIEKEAFEKEKQIRLELYLAHTKKPEGKVDVVANYTHVSANTVKGWNGDYKAFEDEYYKDNPNPKRTYVRKPVPKIDPIEEERKRLAILKKKRQKFLGCVRIIRRNQVDIVLDSLENTRQRRENCRIIQQSEYKKEYRTFDFEEDGLILT